MPNAKMHLKWKSEEMQMSIEDFAIKENTINITAWQQGFQQLWWISGRKR